ncbi:MAG: tyrosine--tRNA ligase [Pseudomonadales bacterium]|nr:tyrosine--tRNA ligase [Pseudomonadales bacterium]
MKGSGDQIVSDLQQLELIAQVSNEATLRAHLAEQPRTVYCGFDPTADSLHIGNLVPLLALRRFQNYGHQPILLVGGATGLIGDPGGRASERTLKPRAEVAAFVDKIREQACRFLDFECEGNPALVVDNADWVNGLDVITYLRDIGKHFSVNAMVQKETVKRRLEDDSAGISYTEFSYMILQSYDFAVLYRDHGCTIQMGGSDQWGNITSGIDLIRRMQGGQAHAVTYPLITKSDGTKFGKSAEGSVWLDPAKTSPYKFYQFWINCADEDVLRFLKIFTFLSTADIAELADAQQSQPGARLAHRRLAQEVTGLVHGESAVAAVERITAAIFSNRIDALTEQDFAQLAQDGLPSTHFDLSEVGLLALLFESGLATTPKGEVTLGQAKKLVLGNSVAVNGVKQIDPEFKLQASAARYGRYHLIQKGKKQHHLVVLKG